MTESRLVQLIMNDILSADTYRVKGIAYRTDTHDDAIEEVIAAQNIHSSGAFLRGLIELHHSVKRDIRNTTIKKSRRSMSITIQFNLKTQLDQFG